MDPQAAAKRLDEIRQEFKEQQEKLSMIHMRMINEEAKGGAFMFRLSRHAHHTAMAPKKEPLDPIPAMLETLLAHAIRSQGCYAHMDTLVSYAQRRYPSLKNSDGSSIRKKGWARLITGTFTDSKSTGQWVPASEDDCWLLKYWNGQKIKNPPRLVDLVERAIAVNMGQCRADTIRAYVLTNWRAFMSAHDVSDDSACEGVDVLLDTSPRFKKSGVFWSLSRRKRSRNSPALHSSKRRKADDSGESSRIRTSNPNLSPVEGESRQSRRAAAKSVCGRCGVSVRKRARNGNKEMLCEECEESGAVAPRKPADLWIMCDKCQQWVSAREDGITDMSLYSDDNPNHLDYYCPACRASNASTSSTSSSKGRRRAGRK
eukprot:TRINITY_DN3094_c0_g1_i1.p1 TRINITY_DN3094_c0_g1~~TRINITY_DN3094_c0_g1_i1.p1  ORF type:complete len:429 (+),score=102.90 TRINITY_DN3094_c0_g1_i1:169-1287(+)